jgi:hypothetical protein
MEGPTPGIRDKSTNEAVFIFRRFHFSMIRWPMPPRLEKTAKTSLALLASGLELRGDFIIGVAQEHLDIRLAVSRRRPGYSAFGDPEGKFIANLASAGDFVLVYCPDKYRLFG